VKLKNFQQVLKTGEDDSASLGKLKIKLENNLKDLEAQILADNDVRTRIEDDSRKAALESDTAKEDLGNEEKNYQRESKLVRDLTAKVSSLQNQIENATGDSSAFDKKIKKILEQIDELRERSEELQDERANLDTARSKLESELSGVEYRLGEESGNRARIEDSVKQMDADANKVRSDGEAIESKNVVLAKNVKKLEFEHSELKQKNEDANRDLQKLLKTKKKM